MSWFTQDSSGQGLAVADSVDLGHIEDPDQAIADLVAAQDGAVTALTRQIAAQDAAALDLSRALETSLGTIAGLQASTSWKLTAPLRALGTLLRKTGGRP